jgi:transglutaminase-like putative cysteine protease
VIYRIRHLTRYEYANEFASCHNQVHLRPRDLPHQRCLEHRVDVRPAPHTLTTHLDSFGNQVSSFELYTPNDVLEVESHARVELRHQPEPPPLLLKQSWPAISRLLRSERAPLDVVPFLFASNHVNLSAKVRQFAEKSFAPTQTVHECAINLTRRIFEEFKFDPRATEVGTPVDQVLVNRKGVCQDFAHLMIACVRSMGLAARYVSGYLMTEPIPGKPRLIGADASHAWVSVWCDDSIGNEGWIEFDPTNNVSPCTKHITVAYGRDFADVSPVRGVVLGGGGHRVSVSVDVARE